MTREKIIELCAIEMAAQADKRQALWRQVYWFYRLEERLPKRKAQELTKKSLKTGLLYSDAI